MRRSDKPYKFRNCKGRAISVEFRFMPGKRLSTGCYDMPSAVLWAEQYLQNNGMPSKAIPTLSEIGKDFFTKEGKGSYRERMEALGYEYPDSYYTQKQAYLDNHILPVFGRHLVTAINTMAIEEFIINKKGTKGQPLANDTKNKILVTFRTIMEEVKRLGYRPDNPAAEARMMAKKSEEREPLYQYELERLFPPSPAERIKIWGNAMWAVYFSIFYDTGMRPGEIAALRVCDIYKTKNGLAVGTDRTINTKERKEKKRVKTTGKGIAERVGLLYWDTAELLIDYIENNDLHGDDLLFHSKKLGILTTPTSLKHFKSVLKKEGLMRDGLVQYSIRHSYETDRRGDMPDEILAISMGHTKLRNDYDHQKAKDLIRRLDKARTAFFENRNRSKEESDIVSLGEAEKKSM